MCRRNHLWGCALIAFGLGLLIGTWLDGGFLTNCFGFALIVVGFGMMKKN